MIRPSLLQAARYGRAARPWPPCPPPTRVTCCVWCVRAHVRCWACSPEGMGQAHIPACAPPGNSALRDNQPLQELPRRPHAP
eukprot:4797998-Prymnesium_polylepis.1